MKFKTFSIVAGSEACNAKCPFCVSKMTPYKRGEGYRLCLTPYYEELETGGMIK